MEKSQKTMEILLQKMKASAHPQLLLHAMGSLWVRLFHVIFIILFSAAAAWGIWVWYHNVYAYEWSTDSKEAYRQAQEQKAQLREQNFTAVTDYIKNRAARFSVEQPALKDPFYP